ncbi:YdcF family protein [Lonepinella sp. BR2930]|uniref:YdcF family protein n=1 Tax=Lonepinella sp. BR2930 TaxID=3434554 RepID=UPI003F6DA930
MLELIKLLTTLILPPASIIILFLLGMICWIIHYKKTAVLTVMLAMSLLYLLSIPYISKQLHNSVVQNDQLTLNDYREAQAIVVLGGSLRRTQELYRPITVVGAVAERLRYAVFLHKETEIPILVTGASLDGTSEAKVMADELFYFSGVEVKWLEKSARNTKENAQFSFNILNKENITKIILVTQEEHMKRAKLLFEKVGFDVLPASVGYGAIAETYKLSYMDFVPQAGTLNSNTQLLKEWLGYWKEK